jgi:Tol biopolymer transport system component
MKKVFYVSLFLFVLTLLFLGVYNFSFVKNPSNPVVDQAKKTAAKVKDAADLIKQTTEDAVLVKEVSSEPAVGAGIVSENALAYFSESGALKTVTLGGGAEEAVMDNLPGKPLRAIWSPAGGKALVLLEKDGTSRWYFVDVSAKSVVPLKLEISSPTWTSLGDRIFYLYTDAVTRKTVLNSAKPDGSDWKAFVPVASKDFYLAAIPKSASVSFWSRPNAFEETTLSSFTTTGSSVKKLFSGKFGADYLWSPNGDKVLVSSVSSKGGDAIALGTANANGGEFHTLQAPTFVSKAAWSDDGKTLYYALPLGMPSGSVLPNDYLGKPIHTTDFFWKMDIETGKSDRIIDNGAMEGKDFDSIDLFLSPDEKYLFFTNRNDGRLYRIEMVQ